MTTGLRANEHDRPVPGRRRRPPVAKSPLDMRPWYWGAGAVALCGLLLIQMYAFEGQRLARNIYARPVLDRVCAVLGCELPPFKDVANIRIDSRSLGVPKGGAQALEFRMVFVNRSELPQVFPDIRLVLDQLGGEPQAERVFPPEDYLGESWQEGALMPIGKPYEIRLFLAKPAKDVGGFTIEFR